jgi:hypothetical protein
MNASAKSTRIPQLRDICPEYRAASEAYERESKKENNERAMEDAFGRMRDIAKAFWHGVEYGRHVPEAQPVRTWRAGE